MEFKVGDKVKFVVNEMLKGQESEDTTPLGYEFVIDYIDDDGVCFDEVECPFLEEELELVERGKNIEHTK